MKWKQTLVAVCCTAAIVAAFIHFSPAVLHPHGPNEMAIWNQILKREEWANAEPGDLRVVRWSRSKGHGDLAPVHSVVVRIGEEQFKVDATAVKYIGEDWQAHILSVEKQ